MSDFDQRNRAVQKISLARQKEMDWKNGGGRTRELWKVDDQEGMLWRASIATIHQSSPFSIFEGCDRIIALIAGGPVLLRFADGENLSLRLFEPQTFSCERPVSAVVEEESRDLNLIWRSDVISVDHAALLVRGKMTTQMPKANWHLVVACADIIAIRSYGNIETLLPGEAVLFERTNEDRALELEFSSERGVAFTFNIMQRG